MTASPLPRAVPACFVCHKPALQAVVVGVIECGSGSGWFIHACKDCTTTHDVLPLAEHPQTTDGNPRRRDTPAGGLRSV